MTSRNNRGLKHLQKIFQFLKNNPDFAYLNNNSNIASQIHSKLFSLGREDKVDISWIEIPIEEKTLKEKHNATILIGGEIDIKENKITRISLALCVTFTSKKGNITTCSSNKHVNVDSCCLEKYGNGYTKRIVRRFHFDYQPGNTPESHLQYGGKFKEEDSTVLRGKYHYCLEHFLEDPRILIPPMDLVLILDFIIRAFELPIQLKNMIKETDWKGLVKTSQEIYWKTYYEKLCNLINSAPSGQTVHEYFYNITK